jgi:hypothetical protein
MLRCKNLKCKEYDTGFRSGDSYCGECGSYLKEDKENDKNKCTCGRFIVPRWKICPNCGKTLPNN